MESNIIKHKVVLAGLLHDIGKFGQRADDNGMRKSTSLGFDIKKLEGAYCPQNRNGFYTHKHVIWTAQFFSEFEEYLGHVFKDDDVDDSIIRVSSMHHHPNSYLQHIIQLADWLSSGVDRSNDPDSQKEVEEERNWDSFKKTKLRSIFESLGRERDIKHEYLLPLKKQVLDGSLMPQKDVADGDYKELWNAFKEEVGFIQSDDPVVIIEIFTELLRKYTSSIPASTIHLPDVSLFDHLKSTASIAHCLYEFNQKNNQIDLNKLKNDPNSAPFLLIGGDLSGIQKYIYDIASKNAAKNLKGRSFYLQLLVESFLERIKVDLELYSLNTIYASGGGFYLLAPNTEENRNKITLLEKEFQQKLFDEFNGELYLALDFAFLSCDDFFEKNISEKWKTISEKLNMKKRQKFIFEIEREYGKFFEPIADGGDAELDAITGQPLTQGKRMLGDEYINESTFEQIELGKELKSVDYWVSTTEEINYWKKRAYNPGNLGIYHYFITKDIIQKYKERLKGSVDRRVANTINDTDFLKSNIQGLDNIYGYKYYGGNDFPSEEDGKPITFDKLAETDIGISRLGVLRMDVDNLGQTFINGMREDKRTFSRYSTLSRNLDWFFKGYLNTLWQSKEEYMAQTQIIYSGGDDLFIVGQWITLVNFAIEINDKFREWTCYNPKLTLSGGIALIGGSSPILKGAIEAEKAEAFAKDYQRGESSKNAFSIFDFALSWDSDLGKVIEWKDKIQDLLKNGLPKSFISKIMVHHSSVSTFHPEISPKRVFWMAAYDLEKLKSRIKDPEIKAFIEDCKIAIYTNSFRGFDCSKNSNYHFLQLIYLAARWADFEQRN